MSQVIKTAKGKNNKIRNIQPKPLSIIANIAPDIVTIIIVKGGPVFFFVKGRMSQMTETARTMTAVTIKTHHNPFFIIAIIDANSTIEIINNGRGKFPLYPKSS